MSENHAMIAGGEQNTSSASASLGSYADALNNLAVYLQAADADLQEIRLTQFRLNTYGLTLHRRYASSVASMTTAFEHAVQSARWFCELLTKDALLRHDARMLPLRYTTLNWPAITLVVKKADTAQNAEAQYLNVTHYLDAMMAAHDTVFSQQPAASSQQPGNYFTSENSTGSPAPGLLCP